MKNVKLLASVLIVFLSSVSCNSQTNNQKVAQTVSSSKVSVYYFHFTRRCATCMAVEENARKAIEALYPNEVKSGDYSFTSLNLDEASTKDLANKLGVGGQTLLVVRGDKKIDITSAAWMAAHNSDKMKEEIKSGINKVLF
ncbi:MAG TPA: nitrophenyl compound nitroreductase subunit ArsF family protein [Bacteroidales bacterium]|nr:nitrophenyl compound nitroreductase subunit ArsF family protein [Bacteroidales bacterium]HPT21490.1 nitrophenyl compound nitroreductase subunit ArsF family protein [Bacteroidales bacterium]